MEKAMAPHSSTLAWKIPWMEDPGGPQSMGLLRVGHDWATSISLFTFMQWRRKWQPTPVFLPGESHGRGNLVGCRLWSRTRLKRLSSSSSNPSTPVWIRKCNEGLLPSLCGAVVTFISPYSPEEKGMTKDEMVAWHHWLNGHEFEETPGVGDGQGGLVCCSPWGHKELDTTEPLNWTDSPESWQEHESGSKNF